MHQAQLIYGCRAKIEPGFRQFRSPEPTTGKKIYQCLQTAGLQRVLWTKIIVQLSHIENKACSFMRVRISHEYHLPLARFQKNSECPLPATAAAKGRD